MFDKLFRKKNFDNQINVIISRADANFKDLYKTNNEILRKITGKIDRINRKFNMRYGVDLFINYAGALSGCHNIIETINESASIFTSLASLLNGCLNVGFFRNSLGVRRFSCSANRCGLRDFLQNQNLALGCIIDNIDTICLFRNALDHPEDIDLKERAEQKISEIMFKRGNTKKIEEMDIKDFQKLWKKSLELANDALIDMDRIF